MLSGMAYVKKGCTQTSLLLYNDSMGLSQILGGGGRALEGRGLQGRDSASGPSHQQGIGCRQPFFWEELQSERFLPLVSEWEGVPERESGGTPCVLRETDLCTGFAHAWPSAVSE